jgi:peptide/nickel transport system substrate-binding protein
MDRLQSGQVNFDVVGNYRRADIPAVGHVIMMPVGGSGAGASSMLGGEIDIGQVTEEEWLIVKEEGFLSVLTPRQGIGALLAVNTQRPPFNDLDLRQALFLALDPLGGREQIWGATAYSAMGVPVVEAGWLLDQERFTSYFMEPGEARLLLEAASPSARRITLTLANFGQKYLDYGDVVAGQLRGVGFEVTLEVLSRADYLTNVWRNRDFQVFVGPLPPTSTTNDFLLSMLHSQGQWNITGVVDAELDRLIRAQSVEQDVQTRGVLVRQIQERVLSQGLIFMPAITIERWAYSTRVTDFYPNLAAGQGSFWESVGIIEDGASRR